MDRFSVWYNLYAKQFFINRLYQHTENSSTYLTNMTITWVEVPLRQYTRTKLYVWKMKSTEILLSALALELILRFVSFSIFYLYIGLLRTNSSTGGMVRWLKKSSKDVNNTWQHIHLKPKWLKIRTILPRIQFLSEFWATSVFSS